MKLSCKVIIFVG